MQIRVDSGFFKRNNKLAIDRYLSDRGFNLDLGYSVSPSGRTSIVLVSENAPVVKKVEKKVKKKVSKKKPLKKAK